MANLPKFQQHQYGFAAHIRNPEKVEGPPDIEDRRMAIYRDLFYNNVEGFLSRSFPVIRKLYNDIHWHEMARDFFAHHQSVSPYFLEIPKEFLTFLENERSSTDDPPFLYELAHYEWAELALSISDDDPQSLDFNAGGHLLDGIPVVSPCAWSLAYRYPVHQIRPDFQPQQAGEIATFIIVYRDLKNKVGFIEINPITARLVELLEANDTNSGRQLLTKLAVELNHPDPDVIINGGSGILNNLHTHDIVLGTKK